MTKIRYDELTWPETREAIARQPVVLLPFGAVEDHGPHLPLNTDNIIVEAICLESAARAPGEMLVMPPVAYGLDEHPDRQWPRFQRRHCRPGRPQGHSADRHRLWGDESQRCR
jgi:creatinine amidohydrolase/Fe(II)-dependent formamide hydrolase-like protein